MIDLSHDGIEVAYDVGIALGVDHGSTALEGIQGTGIVLRIVAREPREVIKRHLIGIIEHTRLAERGNLLPVLL